MRTPFVLIVEDESIIAGLIADVLAMEGCRTKRAATVAHAADLVHAERPDLVILDIRLETPAAGWQLLQAMRQDAQLEIIPVLVCSGDVFFINDHLVALQTPRTDVLCKPFSIDALVEKVHVALGAAA